MSLKGIHYFCAVVSLAAIATSTAHAHDGHPHPKEKKAATSSATAGDNCFYQVSSPDFRPGRALPAKFSKAKDNVSPKLVVAGKGDGIKSFALIVHDPDAPAGTWIHWVVWNLPPDTTEFDSASLPAGAMQGTNSWGDVGYDGPAPPPGTGRHRYVFTLYALDTMLDGLDKSTTAEKLQAAMQGHIKAESSVTGTFQEK